MIELTSIEMKMPPREREVILEELKELLSIHCMTEPRLASINTLIHELEDGAWIAGADEGWDMALAEHR